MVAKNRIIILGTDSPSTRMMFHALSKYCQIEMVIIEDPVSRFHFLRRRVRQLGLMVVTGQMLFKFLVEPILLFASNQRLEQIKSQYNLQDRPIPNAILMRVPSVNNEKTRELLFNTQPNIVVISGTRIISKQTLTCIDVPFLNLHAGITPQYRGVHGGYWALYNNDLKNCGVTLHVVDSGIDTGMIIQQKRITPTKEDNFITYPLLQLAIGIPLMKDAIATIIEKRVQTRKELHQHSRLWSHPTVWQYAVGWLQYGVK